MDKGSYIFPSPKPQTEESFWLDETIHYELDSKDFAIALDEPIYLMENEEQKPLSEVEKAQADVDRYEAKLAEQERELEKTKFYLTICKRSLKAHLKAEEKFKK